METAKTFLVVVLFELFKFILAPAA